MRWPWMRRSHYDDRMREHQEWRDRLLEASQAKIEEANDTIRDLREQRDGYRTELWRSVQALTDVNTTLGPVYAARLNVIERDIRGLQSAEFTIRAIADDVRAMKDRSALQETEREMDP